MKLPKLKLNLKIAFKNEHWPGQKHAHRLQSPVKDMLWDSCSAPVPLCRGTGASEQIGATGNTCATLCCQQ